MWWLIGMLTLLLPLQAMAAWPRPWVKDTCVLGWTAPTTNSDASPLTDLDHFQVCVSNSAGGACASTFNTPNAATTQATCAQLSMTVRSNPYFVRVLAIDSSSNASAASNELTITVWDGRTLIRQ